MRRKDVGVAVAHWRLAAAILRLLTLIRFGGLSALTLTLALTLSFAVHGTAKAQQDPHHTQYLFNQLSLNPAYAGSRGTLSSMLFYRNQWTGFAGAPVTQSFTFHVPSPRNRAGFGVNFINDKIGYTSQQWATFSYAYILPVGKTAHLALGLRGGMMNYRINWSEVTATDLQDPLLSTNARSLVMPTVGTGAFFSSDRFYAGLSVPHILNTPLMRRAPGYDAVARLYRHAYFTMGYVFGINKAVQWKPSILLKYAPGAPLELDVNLMAYIARRFWIGASWRSNDAVALMMDFQIAKHLRLGYAYDYTTTELRNFNSGTHEFLLGVEIYQKKAKMKSPRYF